MDLMNDIDIGHHTRALPKKLMPQNQSALSTLVGCPPIEDGAFDLRQKLQKYPIPVNSDLIVVEICFEGDPVAHQRPRIGRGHTYTPSKTAKYKEALALVLKLKLKNHEDDSSTIYGVQALFYRSNRQRVDLDNLIKTVMDSTTKSGLWKDDSQVVEIAGQLFKAQDNPRVEFIIYRIIDGRTTGKLNNNYNFPQKCKGCGKPISSKGSHPSSIRRFCSKKCFYKSKRVTAICKECRKEFELPGSLWHKRRGFCSRECSIKHHANLKRIKGKESEKWICKICGGRVSRKEYVRCRACWMKQHKEPVSNYWELRRSHEGEEYMIVTLAEATVTKL